DITTMSAMVSSDCAACLNSPSRRASAPTLRCPSGASCTTSRPTSAVSASMSRAFSAERKSAMSLSVSVLSILVSVSGLVFDEMIEILLGLRQTRLQRRHAALHRLACLMDRIAAARYEMVPGRQVAAFRDEPVGACHRQPRYGAHIFRRQADAVGDARLTV